MPRGCRPTGEHALSNAERQARYRARQQVEAAATAATRPRRPTDRRSRPQRWRDAVDTLLTLQAEYAEWLTALPDSLQSSATAGALEAIVDLDLAPLADVELPRGYGRD
jgi:rhamnogalacturonyl hydrolase YesR